MPFQKERLLLPGHTVNKDYEKVHRQNHLWHGLGELIQHLRELQGRMPHPGLTYTYAPVHGLETFALTKDGSQKRVKDTGELTKMVDTD